jgi:plastocyanin
LIRIRFIAVLAAIVALVVAAPIAARNSATSATKLTGIDGPGFTITLKKGSAKVKKLTAGKYTIVVQDKSSAHNFHLKGPGVNKTTSVSKVGNTTWTVTLKKGKYTYVCDPHAAIMKGSFTVS